MHVRSHTYDVDHWQNDATKNSENGELFFNHKERSTIEHRCATLRIIKSLSIFIEHWIHDIKPLKSEEEEEKKAQKWRRKKIGTENGRTNDDRQRKTIVDNFCPVKHAYFPFWTSWNTTLIFKKVQRIIHTRTQAHG